MAFTVEDKQGAIRVLGLPSRDLRDSSQLSQRMAVVEQVDSELGTNEVELIQNLIAELVELKDSREAARVAGGTNAGIKRQNIDAELVGKIDTEYLGGDGALGDNVAAYDEKLKELKARLNLEVEVYQEKRFAAFIA